MVRPGSILALDRGMPRANRSLQPGALFHVFNRGVERRSIFLEDRDRGEFLRILARLDRLEGFDCKTVAYCLMGNHFHLVIQDNNCQLSQAIGWLCLTYARNFNMRHERDGPLFRGRFKSVRIESADQLSRVIDYVHLNPLKDDFVSDPVDWLWSSYRFYKQIEVFPTWMSSVEDLKI